MARAQTAADKAQTRLGRYELLARLATGGMGEIFLARLEGAEGFEKLYVVKRILAHLADDARFRQMLIAEARIASKMSHPNICQVFELGDSDGQLYIVMEYLEGMSLLPLLRRFSKESVPLDLGFVAGVFQQVADAMNYAHELKDRDGGYLGIIHRDVTPSNVYITETGVAKVLDFGIAKARGASTQTQEGTVKGKYAYMAPEQLKGASIDRRVDIFAMGVVLYEMLALRRLFQRKTDYLTFRAVMEQPIPDIRKYRPDVPDGVAMALQRALERDVNNRFDTARQFGSAVLDGMTGYRPWTQGEISDFLANNFAAEIGKRSAQVQSVVQRTSSGVQRTTMPLFVAPDEGQHEDDGDDSEFPSVETEVEGAPPWMPRPQPAPPLAGHSSDFAASTGSGTPPPFSDSPTGSGIGSLHPIRAGSPVPIGGSTMSNPIVVVQKRSIIWPLLAVAMVAIAGGALFLVYQQMQQQQGPAEIKITQESSDKPGPPGNEPAGGTTHVMKGNSADTPTPPEPDTVEPDKTEPDKVDTDKTDKPDKTVKAQVQKPKTFNAAIAEKKAELSRCLQDHSAPVGSMEEAINVLASGKAKNVQLTPASIDSAPIGGCIRNVLMSVNYPPSSADQIIRLPLAAKPKG
jgi:serine/threonine-protein kinase